MENLSDEYMIMVEAINMLTDEQRKELRESLELRVTNMPRNLYFNYKTQEWI